ncbi:uncharacterized protein EV422DRAFT_65554 [Fimicolochytrium jonesii]|uniref:uncharacterized protein n=1 Tax=Fimicolochytrium jonesii TaxID=1396493 RepID=UPI0022FDD1C5|nr:uncharacterized protein EV422DRAFT_65554 [Fimicolochytrium jonesii]KAI8820832.1 hypothetical protein EV422DRAFT_65554 [Fimicolochytrium jonesii]
MDETPSTTRPTSPIPHQEGPTIGPKNLHTGQTVAASFTIQESGGPRAVVYSVRLDSYDPIKGTYRISDPDPDPISLESEWDVSPDDIVDYIAPRQDALEVGTMVYALFNLARVGKRREMSTEFYTAEIKKVLSEGRKGLRYYVHYPDEPGNLSVVYPGEIFPMSEGKWSKSIQ